MKLSATRRQAGKEQGVILILTLFVLFLVIALVTQLSLGAQIAHTATVNRTVDTRMRMAAVSAAEEVLTMLKDDGTGSGSSAMSSALAGPTGFPGMNPGDLAGSGLGPDSGQGDPNAEGEGEEEADATATDSFEDAWARPMRISMGDLEITTFVQDENGKFNLLALISGTPKQREEAFERTVRILDGMRDGFEDDLQEFEARTVVDNIRRYMEADSRTVDMPLMPRNSLDDEALTVRLQTLSELLLVDGVTQDLFYDQLRSRERIAPGIETVFTIWTMPEYDPESPSGSLDGGDAGDAGAAGDQASGFADPSADTGADPLADPNRTVDGEGGLEGALDGDPPIGILINLNTAPAAVLYGMLPSTRLPPVKITNLLEWRNEVDEETLAEEQSADVDPQDVELRESVYGVDEPDPKNFLKSLEELAEIDGFQAEQLDAEQQQELQSLFGVQSDVFRVCIYLRQSSQGEWEPERRYQEEPVRTLRLEATVWRRMAGEEVKILFLEPWHEVPYTRWRIPDFQDDLPPFRAPRYE